MTEKEEPRAVREARHRFGVIGGLLASPPGPGELAARIRKLSETTWQHPVTKRPVRHGFSTIERWFYAARGAVDPIGALLRQQRSDAGKDRALSGEVKELLRAQYLRHCGWTVQLHYDNVLAAARAARQEASFHYSTVRRFMRRSGLFRRRRLPDTPGGRRAARRRDRLETRSYEKSHVGALYHHDFHASPLQVLLPNGEWATPRLYALLDDRSRLVCHAQWYLHETAEDLCHGLGQGLLKRGLCCSLMQDNGAAMVAQETVSGLGWLSIEPQFIVDHSPHQNGKIETFWEQVDARLMAMLEAVPDLTLGLLNDATQAWIEGEYNRKEHRETGEPPLRRFLAGPSVVRPAPSPEALRLAFCVQEVRRQRRGDGTISVGGRRFELPSRLRHLARVVVRYARWDLSFVHVVDPRRRIVICRIYPLDKARNADGRRRALPPLGMEPQDKAARPPASTELPPLLRELMARFAATGLPFPYLHKNEADDATEPLQANGSSSDDGRHGRADGDDACGQLTPR